MKRLLIALALTACGGSMDGLDLDQHGAPPAPQEEKVIERPGYVWTGGHWQWKDRQWQWLSGRWEQKRDGQAWHDGVWEHETDGSWKWTDGSWVKSESATSGG
jgi:hypothetical protein|nr:YXWGXW repeat-containing protein [Kofleriaceae bacterium]